MRHNVWKKTLAVTVGLAASIIIFIQYRRAADFAERSDCAAYFLDKAKTLQEKHLKTDSNVTEQSQLDLMEQINFAYNCVMTPASHSRIAPGGGSFGQHGVLPHR